MLLTKVQVETRPKIGKAIQYHANVRRSIEDCREFVGDAWEELETNMYAGTFDDTPYLQIMDYSVNGQKLMNNDWIVKMGDYYIVLNDYEFRRDYKITQPGVYSLSIEELVDLVKNNKLVRARIEEELKL